MVKRCACGTEYSETEWASLPPPPGGSFQDFGDGTGAELRNCESCQSTLAVEVPRAELRVGVVMRECNGCYRQVRTTDSVCPFCKTDPGAPPEPDLSAREKTRRYHQRNPNHRRAQMGTFPGARQAPKSRGVK